MSTLDRSFTRRSAGPRAASAAAVMLALAAALMATPRPCAAGQAAPGRPEASSERPERAGAVAAGEPVIALSSGLVLHAGERLEIRWSVSETSVDELEILL